MNNPFEIIDARLSNIESLLLDLKHKKEESKQSSCQSDQWFDIEGFCNYHPDRPKKSTVYGWVHQRSVPFHKVPGKKGLTFSKNETDEWLKSGKVKTNTEVEAEALHLLNRKSGRS